MTSFIYTFCVYDKSKKKNEREYNDIVFLSDIMLSQLTQILDIHVKGTFKLTIITHNATIMSLYAH
jgi:hypothetical protein